MSIGDILKRKGDRLELKIAFTRALYPYLDDSSYAVANDVDEDSYSIKTKAIMERHENLMKASASYRAAFYAFKDFKDFSDRVDAEARKQGKPFQPSLVAMAAFALANARTIISAHRNLNRMFDIYDKATSKPQPPM